MLAVAVAGCAAPPYAPCPVELTEPLPDDAFARCRGLLLREYGALVEADQAAFRLQTQWLPIADPPGERRATVFLESGVLDSGLLGRPEPVADLAVVVELRWLTIPWFGVPEWTVARGDALAERELARALREALAAVSDG